MFPEDEAFHYQLIFNFLNFENLMAHPVILNNKVKGGEVALVVEALSSQTTFFNNYAGFAHDVADLALMSVESVCRWVWRAPVHQSRDVDRINHKAN